MNTLQQLTELLTERADSFPTFVIAGFMILAVLPLRLGTFSRAGIIAIIMLVSFGLIEREERRHLEIASKIANALLQPSAELKLIEDTNRETLKIYLPAITEDSNITALGKTIPKTKTLQQGALFSLAGEPLQKLLASKILLTNGQTIAEKLAVK